MLCPDWGPQLKQKAICTPDAPIDAAASHADAQRGHTTPSLLLPCTVGGVVCSGRLCYPQPPAAKASAGREHCLGPWASALSTSRHRHSRDTQEPFCTLGQGWHRGCCCATTPLRTGTGSVVPTRKESSLAISQVGGFLAKKVQILVYGSKHAVCLMNALFISCVSCWKYQNGQGLWFKAAGLGPHSSLSREPRTWESSPRGDPASPEQTGCTHLWAGGGLC